MPKKTKQDDGDVQKVVNDAKIGELPEGWQVVKLGELLTEKKEKNKENHPYPVFTVSNKHGFFLSDDFFDKQVYSQNLSTYKVVRKNCFAYNPYRVNVGSLDLFSHAIGLVSPAYVVFNIQSNKLSEEFLLRLLKSESFISKIYKMSMGRGSVRKSMAFSDLSSFSVFLPPLLEQKNIATVLSDLQDTIAKTEAVIESLRNLKKAMMRHLFTYGPVAMEETEQVKLKETEIGMMPEEWEVVKLESLCESIRYGTSQQCAENHIGQPVLRIPNVVGGRIDIQDLKFAQLPEKESQRLKLQVGDLLFVRTNGQRQYTGRCSVFRDEIKEALFASYLIRVRLKPEKLLPNFLQNYTETPRGRSFLSGKASGAADGKFNINSQTIRNVLLPFPPLPIQQKITEILSALDAKIQAEESKKNSLEFLFKTLLELLMTGKIRITSLETTL